MLEVTKLSCGYYNKTVFKNLSLKLSNGEVIGIIGANGIGKTTLFQAILGNIKPFEGNITIDNVPVADISNKSLAQKIGYVPQAHVPPFPFEVLDVVVMGRTAHLPIFSGPSKSDMKMALETLEILNIGHLANRIYTEISGGERQLVLIARALVQQPEILILDEPTSNLDFGNQWRILVQIKKLAKRGLGVLLTTHYPDHVLLCASKVLVLRDSQSHLCGLPEEVMTRDVLHEIYGIGIDIHELTNVAGNTQKVCVPDIREM